jgi:DNA-nicking Smr family endonuclease
MYQLKEGESKVSKISPTMGLKDFIKNLFMQTNADVQPTLDLHGLSVKEAVPMTAEFVKTSFRAGVSPVRIVYGKGLNSPGGRGILREVIPRWCEKEGNLWVESFRREVDAKGGDGSILLFIRSKDRPQSDVQRDPSGPTSISE